MYLRYQLQPHFTQEKFNIEHPVANAQEGEAYMKMLLTKQDKGKTYGQFALLDMAKNVLKIYPLRRKRQQIKQNQNYRQKL
ncbi:hypothetical protein QFZ51_003517 [Chitinophaga sp. W3I9]|uniref:hypothetical protein n=1 Tax=Chitinophaga sp. W3I9 TaxID=3373924 RepID=UPI003D1B74E2